MFIVADIEGLRKRFDCNKNIVIAGTNLVAKKSTIPSGAIGIVEEICEDNKVTIRFLSIDIRVSLVFNLIPLLLMEKKLDGF